MKLAVFGTMWNEEVMMYYYNGLNRWAQETGSIVDMFTCYGRTNRENPYNVGEYAIFDYPDLTEYDGAIMIASNINEPNARAHLADCIRKANLPCVTMDYAMEGFSHIYIDQGCYVKQMVEHLHEQHGVTKIAYISGLVTNVEAASRLKGYRDGMIACGLGIRDEWIFEKHFYFNDGYDVVVELLERGGDFPEAIVCANDDMAAGACEALQDHGIKVGEECRVTGFDQYFLGENYSPSLTTVRRPRESIIYHACQMLEHYIGPVSQQEQAGIFIGRSCGCNQAKHTNGDRFRRYVFNTFNHRDIFSTMLAHMEEDMIIGADMDMIMERVDDVFSRFKSGRCRILVQPDMDDPESDTKKYTSYRTCTKEYLIWEKSGTLDTRIPGHAYVYAPIHFLDRLYGFLVFRDMPQFLNNKELYNFTKSIGFSLENMIQKRDYARVNGQLESLYETDYLTGTYNRHGYAKYAAAMLEESRSKGETFQIAFADVDGLKKINDIYGHEAGDIVIRLIGNALRENITGRSKVFRYGGDEFLVVHQGDGGYEEYREQVRATVEKETGRP